MVKAWYLDNPAKVVSLEQLRSVGILYWHIPAETYKTDGKLDALCAERQYKNRDEVCISPTKMPNFDERQKIFFTEHLHEDEEVRYILDGSGYFDVRDASDQWVRIHVEKSDLIILPAGIYHRFCCDDKKYTHAMRIFKEEPKWTPYNRADPTTDSRVSRSEWQTLLQNAPKPNANGQAYVLPESAAALAHYPHARAVNGFYFVSGLSARQPDNSVPADIAAQTHGCIANLKRILAAVGADLSHVVDMQVFLVDIAEYQSMNEVYNQYFSAITGPTRTTVAVKALPGPTLRIELKAIAVLPK